MKIASLISGDTVSAESFALVQEWLQMCTENHKDCEPEEDAPLPRHVLDIDQQDVHVYETQNELSWYICLSHCWGTRQLDAVTTCTTLPLYKQHISWAKLSKFFQDAVDFCCWLDVQYLWIDSLCILQDDKQDWQEEFSKMAAIYTNSYLTIAATKSSSGVSSCYSTARDMHKAHQIKGYNLYVCQTLPHVQNYEISFIP